MQKCVFFDIFRLFVSLWDLESVETEGLEGRRPPSQFFFEVTLYIEKLFHLRLRAYFEDTGYPFIDTIWWKANTFLDAIEYDIFSSSMGIFH